MALVDLEEATEGRMGGTIEGDMVYWKCQPTPSQARHLAKKKAAKDSASRRNQPTRAGELLPRLPHPKTEK
jgi:hypothetical protein